MEDPVAQSVEHLTFNQGVAQFEPGRDHEKKKNRIDKPILFSFSLLSTPLINIFEPLILKQT